MNIIEVERLSKKYLISHQKQRGRYTALRDVISDNLRNIFSKQKRDASKEEFWALKDVSFNVEQGDKIGIIGRNGAGKSTLLKILSRITEPSEGRVKIKGRVASLLEVGTGFHPELTGRENIYLNGSILGMKKAEIKRKFDEIVSFSEIEKFLDTPVKRYSSGMYVRLAFSVAAHLEPEILLIDEVLAVGDAEFQKKCLGKMDDVSKEGRTIMFVSHNMPMILNLCRKGILIEKGKIQVQDEISYVVKRYSALNFDGMEEATKYFSEDENKEINIRYIKLLKDDKPTRLFSMGDNIKIEIGFISKIKTNKPIIGILISSQRGEKIININNLYLKSERMEREFYEGKVIVDLNSLPLTEDIYYISLSLSAQGYEFQKIDSAISFEIVSKDLWGNGHIPENKHGILWWPATIKYSGN
jgi:lipopolysaccharide transport system ATP-binding protein